MESTRRQQPVIPVGEPQADAPSYRLRTLGQLRVDGPAGEIRELRRKERVLLAYLARAGGPTRRAELLALLWGSQPEARAKHSLRQALCALRKALPEVVCADGELVSLARGSVELDLAALECDVRHGRVAEAAARWQGEFLAGVEDAGDEPLRSWIEAERAAVRRLVVAALEELVSRCATPEDAEAALEPVRRWAEAHPWDEAAQCMLVRLLHSAGRSAEGAAQHARAAERLREELGRAPSPDFERLRDAPVVSLATWQATFAAGWRRVSGGDAAVLRLADATPAEVIAFAEVSGAATVLQGAAAGEQPWTLARQLLAPIRGARGVSAAPDPVLAEVSRIVPELRARWPQLPAAVGCDVVLEEAVRATLAEIAAETPVLVVAHDAADADEPSRRLLAALAEAPPPALLLVFTGAVPDAGPAKVGAAGAEAGTAAVGRGAAEVGGAEEGAGAAAVLARAGAGTSTPGVPWWRRGGRRRRRVAVAVVALLVVVHLPLVIRLVRGGADLPTYGTTTSAARASYDAGLHAMQAERDLDRALRHFTDALEQDSSFALAAYFAGVSAGEVVGAAASTALLARAESLAVRMPERERLFILAGAALRFNDPSAAERAAALVRHSPDEPEGRLLLASSLMLEGRFADAAAELQRAIAMDPPAGAALTGRCTACAAHEMLVSAWWMADSVDAALQTARAWVALQPSDPAPLMVLASHLTAAGEFAEAAAVRQRAVQAGAAGGDDVFAPATAGIRSADFQRADAGLDYFAVGGGADVARQAAWLQAISFRHQRRHDDAWRAATRYRELSSPRGGPAVHPSATPQAIVLIESGQPRRAAAMFDTMFHTVSGHGRSSRLARDRAWLLTLRAAALAAAGDTAGLDVLADSIQRIGMSSGYGRDRRLHHHVRGLLLSARGDLHAAEHEFRSAIFSPTSGYTRTNVELARVLLRRNRAADAIAPLQAALRAPLDGPALYVTRTEVYELLASAWAGAGQPDSAAAWQHLADRSLRHGADEREALRGQRRVVARR